MSFVEQRGLLGTYPKWVVPAFLATWSFGKQVSSNEQIAQECFHVAALH
jgi:hypothetical protein